MKAFALASLAAAAYAASDAELRFINYVAKFAKDIRDSDDFAERLEKFQRNDAFIRIFNATEQKYEVGYTAFTDMDDDDFEAMLGAIPTIADPKYVSGKLSTKKTKESVDWRDAGIITEVKQ